MNVAEKLAIKRIYRLICKGVPSSHSKAVYRISLTTPKTNEKLNLVKLAENYALYIKGTRDYQVFL